MELLILQRPLSGLEAKVDRLGEENVRLRQNLIRTQGEVERLREHLALRDENLLLRLQQLLAERLLSLKRR
jgi:hypothetical protein